MADDPDLFGSENDAAGDEERAPSSFFAAVADAGERRGVGRPKGARNKKSADFEKWYYARGFKDPAQVLGELASMDPIALHGLMVEHAMAHGTAPKALPMLDDAIAIVRASALDLMPYLHGKKPTEVVLSDERLPILVVASGTNQMAEAAKLIEGRAVMSIGMPVEANEINDLEGDE
jgi:hypothetical protein